MSEPVPVGIAVIGHGDTASRILAAAQGILPAGSLARVVAVDAGIGETPELGPTVCDVIERVDLGAGVVVFVDLLGASPCQCVTREGVGHEFVILSGLNLAMLLKLATLDRQAMSPAQIAQACADSGQRSVQVNDFRPDERASGKKP